MYTLLLYFPGILFDLTKYHIVFHNDTGFSSLIAQLRLTAKTTYSSHFYLHVIWHPTLP